MFKNNKMQYIIRSCSSENVQELQNLLNEMSMNGWELYSKAVAEKLIRCWDYCVIEFYIPHNFFLS